MIIDFKSKFQELENGIFNNQKKLEFESCLKIFYGINKNGNIRLSFLSSIPAPKFISIEAINIEQGMEGINNYWTSFDLTNSSLTEVFYSFCNHMSSSVYKIKDEMEALNILMKHYNMWKKLFKSRKESLLSEKEAKGLYGELYFIDNYLLDRYSPELVIGSWVGGDYYSKDFSILNTWYEVKTISPNSDTIHINSLTQLDSVNDGYLTIIKAETMAATYNDGKSKIYDLFEKIMDRLPNLETKELFVNKLIKRSFVPGNELDNKFSFRVASCDLYLVNDKFPRLKSTDILFQEINNIEYNLIVLSLDKYKVGD